MTARTWVSRAVAHARRHPEQNPADCMARFLRDVMSTCPDEVVTFYLVAALREFKQPPPLTSRRVRERIKGLWR